MKNFKNIVFDLGNVLVRLDSQACINAFTELGLAHYLDAKLHPEGHVLMHKLGLGLISTEDFCKEVRRMSRLSVTDKQIIDATNKMLVEIPDVKKKKLLQLKSHGKRLFLLSNTIDMHWDYCVKYLFPYNGYNVDDYFEKVFLSQRMHLDKPNPEILDKFGCTRQLGSKLPLPSFARIFKEVVRQTGISADDTLFIDDLEANCNAARQSVGWNIYQNKNFDDWLRLF